MESLDREKILREQLECTCFLFDEEERVSNLAYPSNDLQNIKKLHPWWKRGL